MSDNDSLLLVGLVRRCVLARDRERVELVAVVVLEKWVPGTGDSRLEHAEAERGDQTS